MISLQNMKYVINIAKHQSISAAAKALYVSQSTLSTAVKEVEEQLGIILFNRNNRGITVTLDGQDFINQAQDIVEQSDYLESRYKRRGCLPMRFSVSTQRLPFATLSFTDTVSQLDLPHYDIAIRECPTHEVIHDVASRRSELGVLCINPHYVNTLSKLFSDNNLIFTQLGIPKLYVFLHRGHPLSQRESLTLMDLKPYPFVTFDQGEDAMLHFSEEILVQESWDKNIHVIDRCSKIALVRRTDAFSIGPDLTNSDADKMHAQTNEVCAIPLKDKHHALHAGYITRNGHSLSDTAKCYIDYLTQIIIKLESN